MTGFATLITYLSNTLLVSDESLIMMTLLFPLILFYAADFKVGVISSIVAVSGLFIFFYEVGYEYQKLIILLLILIVVLAFTLYFINQKGQQYIA